MASITFDGLDIYQAMLAGLGKETLPLMRVAVYEGAGMMADEIRAGIEALPVVDGYAPPGYQLPGGVNEAQKAGLLNGLGISGIRNDSGYVNARIGFDGYNSQKTATWPNGVPNVLVARAAESGTSWKKKSPFVRPAVNRAKAKITKAMASSIDRGIEKLMK